METTKWKADPVHSEMQFKARHLMLTTVTGHFSRFDLDVETEGEDFAKVSKILFTADVDSINTHNTQRDTHLKSNDFFAAEKYKELRFEGRYFERHGAKYLLQGELTIRDITKPITVEVEYGGIITDPWGQRRAGFTVDGRINRKDFNLTWDAVTEAGQVVVGNEVKVHGTIELVRQVDQDGAKKERRQRAEV